MALIALNKVDFATFQLVGQVNYNNVPALWEKFYTILKNTAEKSLTIDLSKVDKMDMSAIALLVAWKRLAFQQFNCTLFFSHPSVFCYKLIEVTKLEGIFLKSRP